MIAPNFENAHFSRIPEEKTPFSTETNETPLIKKKAFFLM